MDLSTTVERVKRWLKQTEAAVEAGTTDVPVNLNAVVTEVDQQQLVKWTTWLEKAAAKALGLVIDSQETFEGAVKSALALRDLEDAVKAARKLALAPLKDEHARVTGLHDVLWQGFETARQVFERKAGDWDRAEKKRLADEAAEQQRLLDESRRRQEEAERAAVAAPPEEQKQLDMQAADAYLEHKALEESLPVVPTRPVGSLLPTGSFASREERTYELVDLEQVPRQYLMLNPAAVKTALKAGVADIPGLRISTVPVDGTRRKRKR